MCDVVIRRRRQRRFRATDAAGAASDATGAVPPTGFVALPASSVVPPNRQRRRHAGVDSDAAPFGLMRLAPFASLKSLVDPFDIICAAVPPLPYSDCRFCIWEF